MSSFKTWSKYQEHWDGFAELMLQGPVQYLYMCYYYNLMPPPLHSYDVCPATELFKVINK